MKIEPWLFSAPLKEQLKSQGMKLSRDTLRVMERLLKAKSMLWIHGVLTPAEKNRIQERIKKMINEEATSL